MREPLPIGQRKVAKTAARIDPERILRAMKRLQEKYSIPVTGCDKRGIPTYNVSSDRIINYSTGRPISGTAHPNRTFTLYEPGILSRMSRGFSLKLTVLEAMLHENLHCFCDTVIYTGTYADGLSSVKCSRRISGYRELFYFGNSVHTVQCTGNECFNEGVTQLLTLELMREYLDLGPFLGMKSWEFEAHFRTIRFCAPGTFYPYATSFVQAVAKKIGPLLGSEQHAYEKIFQDYFCGMSIQHNEAWVGIMQAAGIEKIMLNVKDADYNSLPVHEAKLTGTRGAWDEVELSASNLRPAE